ncbi:MAG: hypothetical protein GXZ03_06795 [Proteiniphilum sp.]|nr:hypothetical protein [Proteiniphilum sp.]
MKQKLIRSSKALVLLLLLLLLGYSCKQDARVIDVEFARYISAFTYGSVSTDAFVQVELTQDIPAVEIGGEVKNDLFSISPSVNGSTFWVNNNTVRFVPEINSLKPGQKYRVKFNLGKVLNVETKFKTFEFDFYVNSQSFSVDLSPYSPTSSDVLDWNSVEGIMGFSNPIDAKEVVKMISVKNSKDAVVRATPVSSVKYKISIDSLQRTNDDKTYSVIFDGKAIGAKMKHESEINIPSLSADNFHVVDVRTSSSTEKYIRVTFSDPISVSQNLEGLFTLSGIKNYTYRLDKNVLKIYPESFPSEAFTLNIYKGLNNISGLYLEKDYEFQLQVEGDKPQIKMDKGGNILPNSDNLILPFSAVNLWAVDVKVMKIYQNNIKYYLQSKSLNNDYSNGEVRRFGRLIMNKQLRLDKNKSFDLTKWNNFSLDLSELIKDDLGAMYIVQMSMSPNYSLYNCGNGATVIPSDVSMKRFADNTISEEDDAIWDLSSPYYYESFDWSEYDWRDRDDPCKPSYFIGSDKIVSSLVMASNIGVIAKSSLDDKMAITVADITTAKPISGAEITIYNYQMQVIGSGKSDANGFSDIEYSGGLPYLVTATSGDDIGYLEVSAEASLSLSSFDVSGKEIQKGLKGYAYTERGVWRPGDSIYLSFILEDMDKKLPKDHPVTLEVYTPKNQIYQRQVNTKSTNGFYTFLIETDPSVETGMWQAYLKVGGASFYKSLRIETIKPNRLKVRFDTDSIIEAKSGSISGTLNSQWLHGAPASNLKAEIELSLYKSDAPFKDYMSYTFNNPLLKFDRSKTELFNGTLSQSGTANVSARIPSADNAPGMLRGNLLSRVYEQGGDMSFYSQTVFYSPYTRYIGIKSPSSQRGFLETNSPINFDVAMVNSHGKGISGDASYKIYKLNWSWWWNSTNEDLATYVHSSSANVVASGETSIKNGKGNIKFQVDYPEWGRYLVLVNDKEGGHSTGTIFYVDWPSSYGRSMKTDPNSPTMLSFTTDKDKYDVGDKAVISIPGSANGNALVSIENSSGILLKEWVRTTAEEGATLTINITKEMAPNFYIFVTLLQPHSQSDNDLPIRMYGVQNVSVDNKNSKLSPIIKMPDVLKPEQEFTISVSEKENKPMTYTIAIVDDGLLDLTAFKTPNAWGEFYAREALNMRTWDLYNRVIGANSGRFASMLSIGGDEALKASDNNVNRFKSVVKFMGPYSIKAGETSSHKVTLPQYVGSVRTMVVAGGDGAYGSSEKTTEVKSSLMTLSTLPRVLGPNEEVWLPVNVFALESGVNKVQVSIKTGGKLKPIGESTQTVSFTKAGDKVVYFKFKVDSTLGAEHVEIKSTTNGSTFTETIDIEIRNPIQPVVLTKSQLIDSEGTATLEMDVENINPNDWAKLELSRLPSVNFSKNINFLLDYPHACTEQIISQGFPLLYMEEFEALDEAKKKINSAKVNEIIRVVSSRQLSDGGFAYWSGNRYATEWVTTYAGHFLLEAKNRGYNVSDNVILRWVQFQKRMAQNWSYTTPYQGYYSISMTDLQQAYRLYALALSGNTEQGAMNRLREISDLSLQARWRLSAAYAIAGRSDVANELVFNVNDYVEEYSFNNASFGSASRDRAMILETYVLLDKIDKAMSIAPSVAESLSSGYITTQTAAFGLVSMAKLAAKMGQGNIDIDWKINGTAKERINTPKAIYQTDLEQNKKLSIELKNNSNAKLYALLTRSTQPLTDEHIKPTSASFDISVRYVGVDNKSVNVGSIEQGKEFIAEVTVRNGVEQSFTDLALTQVFASGWEILNERVLDANVQTSPSVSNYTYRDIRDDRVLTYFNLGANETKTFRVRLQAAYKGRYYLPAVSCQAMYAPNEQARNSGMWVEVGE